VRTHPLVSVGWTADAPRSAMFVPVATKNECVGVIEVGNRRHLGYFTPEEQAALQHLANQVATSITLQAQQEIREQLFRGEKLAATGQLISAIAGELKAPLDSIVELSSRLASLPPSERTAADLRQLAAESARASEIVSRLVSFARPEDSSALPVDANAVIGELVRFREPQWKERGLRVTNKISPEPASVLGARGQLEQVFLNILVHAEQSAAAASGKSLSIGTSSMGGRLVVEIQYSSDAPGESVISAEKSGGGGLGLDVCRGIVQSHGGQIRLVTRTGFVGIEIDLPIDESSQPQTRPAARTSNSRNLTLMVVDHDPAAQRQLLALLTARGHRVVPVPSEQAADLSQRMRFDAVLWAIRAGGAKWSDNQGRLRNYVPFFVLISDGYDADLASSLAQSGGRLLSRPVQARDLDDILEAIGSYDPARVPA
jgi:CheY-like chemotaxis protein